MSSQSSEQAFVTALREAGWRVSPNPDRDQAAGWDVFHARYRVRDIDVLLLGTFRKSTWLGNVVRVQIRSTTGQHERWGWWHDTAHGRGNIDRHWQVSVGGDQVSVVVALSKKALSEGAETFGQLMAECVLVAYDVATDLEINGAVKDDCDRMEPGRGAQLAAKKRRSLAKRSAAGKVNETGLATWKDGWFRFNFGVLFAGVVLALLDLDTHGVHMLEPWDARMGLMLSFFLFWLGAEVVLVRTRWTSVGARRFEKMALFVSLFIETIACGSVSVLLVMAQLFWLISRVSMMAGQKVLPQAKSLRDNAKLEAWITSLKSQGWVVRDGKKRSSRGPLTWTDSVAYGVASKLSIVGRQISLQHAESHLRLVLTMCETSWPHKSRQGLQNLPDTWLDMFVSSTGDEPVQAPTAWEQGARECDGGIGLAVKDGRLAGAADVMDGLVHLVRQRAGGRELNEPYRS